MLEVRPARPKKASPPLPQDSPITGEQLLRRIGPLSRFSRNCDLYREWLRTLRERAKTDEFYRQFLGTIGPITEPLISVETEFQRILKRTYWPMEAELVASTFLTWHNSKTQLARQVSAKKRWKPQKAASKKKRRV
jgi:hypothetical protein